MRIEARTDDGGKEVRIPVRILVRDRGEDRSEDG